MGSPGRRTIFIAAAICLLALCGAAAIIPRLGSPDPDPSIGALGSDAPSASGDAPTSAEGVVPTTLASPTPSIAPQPGTNGGPGAPAAPRSPRTDPRYANCAQVIAAGLGPYKQGRDPEYAWYWDDDGDGWVCERATRTKAAPSPPVHPTRTRGR